MEEREWLTSTDWPALWHALSWGERFDRKRRLIVTAISREFADLLTDSRFIRIMDLSETVADRQIPDDGWDVWEEAHRAAEDGADEIDLAAQGVAACLAAGLGNDDHKIGRALEWAPDVFGYRALIKASVLAPDASREAGRAFSEHPVFVAGRDEEGGRVIADVIRDIFGNPFRTVSFGAELRTSTAVALAKQMYDSRDFGAMPILADALQDAGCEVDDILNHCRDASATHVRGCWVVDLVLGKS